MRVPWHICGIWSKILKIAMSTILLHACNLNRSGKMLLSSEKCDRMLWIGFTCFNIHDVLINSFCYDTQALGPLLQTAGQFYEPENLYWIWPEGSKQWNLVAHKAGVWVAQGESSYMRRREHKRDLLRTQGKGNAISAGTCEHCKPISDPGATGSKHRGKGQEG